MSQGIQGAAADARSATPNAVAEFDLAADPVLFSFGMITDIQHADQDIKNNERHYRNALIVTENAVQWWRESPSLSFVVHGGDIVDEAAFLQGGREASSQALNRVLSIFHRLGPERDVLCMVGNHELYNFSRNELLDGDKFGNCRFADRSGKFFYRYEPPTAAEAGWRFLVLDSYDCSVMSGGQGAGIDKASFQAVCANNENFSNFYKQNPDATITDLNSKVNWWNGIPSGASRRWTPANGGLSLHQLDWFRQELQEASAKNLKVAIFCHVPLLEQVSDNGELMLWNYENVLEAMHHPEHGRCVQAVFSGHRHSGGYAVDSHGIHHCVFESALHPKPGEIGVFARIEVGRDAIRVVGYAPTYNGRQERSGRVLAEPDDPAKLRVRVLKLR